MDQAAIDKQREVGEFVSREVCYCVSSLIHELVQDGNYMDELMAICSQDDYEEPLADYINDMMEGNCKEYLDENEIEYEDTASIGELQHEVRSNIYALDEEQKFCMERDIEPYRDEALEHWIVSDFLATKLIARGEMVTRDFFGLTIWGRGCSGQAIKLDGVIVEIYDGMMGHGVGV